ncbi:hypothetical protein B0A49_13423, partial [Cryomyces minteri]
MGVGAADLRLHAALRSARPKAGASNRLRSSDEHTLLAVDDFRMATRQKAKGVPQVTRTQKIGLDSAYSIGSTDFTSTDEIIRPVHYKNRIPDINRSTSA